MSEKSGVNRRLAGILVLAVIVIAGAYYYYVSSTSTATMSSTSMTSMMPSMSSVSAMSSMPSLMIQQNATTTDYKLQFILGPPGQMLTMNETATATAGEVMVSGQMVSMMMGANMTGTYHLEVHVYGLATGSVVTDKNVTIQILNNATGQVMSVPIVEMYDMMVGPSDTHFGNNVSLAPGNYTITVTVADETAIFHITIPG